MSEEKKPSVVTVQVAESTPPPTKQQVTDLAAENLRHELMACALDELKVGNDPWQKLSEELQDEIIERVERRVTEAVRAAIHLISSHGFVRMPAKLDSITVKDGLKAVLSLNQLDPARHQFIDAQGSVVTLVLASTQAFIDAPHQHKPDPDQPNLDLTATLTGIAGAPESQPPANDGKPGDASGDLPKAA